VKSPDAKEGFVMKTPYKPLPFSGAKINEKLLKIQADHHKEFRPLLYKGVVVIHLFVGMMGLGVWGFTQGEWWGYTLGVVGFILFGYSLLWIFKLGGRDDRSYFLKCIEVADDEYELAEIGFDEQYDHIEKIIFDRLLNEHPITLGENPYIVKLHQKHDLRRLADEVEE
jgi:hypothetical protein